MKADKTSGHDGLHGELCRNEKKSQERESPQEVSAIAQECCWESEC